MAWLSGPSADLREANRGIVAEAYRLRSAYLHHARRIDAQVKIEQFLAVAWSVLISLPHFAKSVPSREEFLTSLDKKRFGG